MENCEFCLELKGIKPSRFSDIYPNLTSRIVAETDHFVAIPTIGPLFLGHLLILPRAHVDTAANLEPQQKNELISFLDSLTSALQELGNPVCFEHGALACTKGACGIYHAHIHLVPLPLQIKPEEIFPEFTGRFLNLADTLNQFNHCEEYLLFGNETGFSHAAVEKLQFRPQSQLFRKRLADHFRLTESWNWRLCTMPEPHLLETIAYFRQTLDGKSEKNTSGFVIE
jgi:diadenosine tetraphosphate (Ap4A) HIT family hydrolase